MGIKLLIGSSMHFGATKILEKGTTILLTLPRTLSKTFGISEFINFCYQACWLITTAVTNSITL